MKKVMHPKRVASCSLNPPGLCKIHLGQTERNESGTSVQCCMFLSYSTSFLLKKFNLSGLKGLFILMSTYKVRRSSRTNKLTSDSSFAHQSDLIRTNYLCIYMKKQHP